MKTILVVHALLAAAALVWMAISAIRTRRATRRAAEILRLHGKIEGPPTLHPVIDADLCIGSGACVRACPEDSRARARQRSCTSCTGLGLCRPRLVPERVPRRRDHARVRHRAARRRSAGGCPHVREQPGGALRRRRARRDGADRDRGSPGR